MKRKKNIIFVTILVFVFAAGNIFASNTKTYDGIILTMPVTAANAALANANASFVDNINSLTSNPAGLAELKTRSFAFSHFSHFQDINVEYAALAIPVNNTNVNIGFDYTLFNSGSIEKTMIDNNANPIAAGAYKNYENLFGLFYAMKLKNDFNIGAGVKLINSKLADVSAQTARCSIGMQKFFPTSEYSKFAFSFDIRNLGGELKYDSEKNKAKEIYRTGFGMIFDSNYNKIKTGVDIEYVSNDKLNYFAGIDVLFARILSLRGGYDSRNDVGNKISLGFGLNINSFNKNKINIDYSYTPYGDLGNSHRFSLAFDWGKHQSAAKKNTAVKPQFNLDQENYNAAINKNSQNNNLNNSSNNNLTESQLFNKILLLIMSGDFKTAHYLLNDDFINKRILPPNKFIMLNNMLIERKK